MVWRLGLALVDECGRLSAARPYLHHVFFSIWVLLGLWGWWSSSIFQGCGQKDRATRAEEPGLYVFRTKNTSQIFAFAQEIWIKMS